MSLAAIGMMAGVAGAGAAAAGATLVGSALTGVASAWSARSERKAEEKSIRDQEKRRAAQYEGLGQASRYWNDSEPSKAQSLATQNASTPALGRRPDQVGSKYAVTPTTQLPAATKPRWSFDPQSGGIRRA